MDKKLVLGFVMALILAIVAGSLLVKRANVIETECQALRGRVAELEDELAKSRQGGASSSADKEVLAQKSEIMRLRAEVTQLRENRDAAQKAKTENEKLRTGMRQVRAAGEKVEPKTGESIPRDQWKFEGYATPEAAFISGMWAMKEGQLEELLKSFTPEERQRFETQMGLKSDEEVAARFQKEFGPLTGVRVVGQKETAPGEVVMDVYLEGIGALKKYRMTQVGDEWKAGGPVNQNAAYDPMAFYRKNPELMKRYFPHLYNETQQQGAAQQ